MLDIMFAREEVYEDEGEEGCLQVVAQLHGHNVPRMAEFVGRET